MCIRDRLRLVTNSDCHTAHLANCYVEINRKGVVTTVTQNVVLHSRNRITNTNEQQLVNKKGTLIWSRIHHSTADQLVYLENAVQNSFIANKHMVAIFFDLEKEFDKAWRYSIMQQLHDWRFRGNLPNFITSFLRDRTCLSFLAVFWPDNHCRPRTSWKIDYLKGLRWAARFLPSLSTGSLRVYKRQLGSASTQPKHRRWSVINCKAL